MIGKLEAYAVVVDGKVKHIRLDKGVAEASKMIEESIYNVEAKVIPVTVEEMVNDPVS